MSYKSSIKNWEGLAKRDALWSILTDSSKKDGKWQLEEFYRSGKEEVEAVWSLLDSLGALPAERTTALDFGCGAGRLSRALYPYFEKVTGIDASPTMVEVARKQNSEYLDKLEFKVNKEDRLGLLKDDTFSFVFTSITLQHIPYPHSVNFIKEFLRVLKPGGTAVFQIPTEDVREPSLWQRFRSFIRFRERLAMIGIGDGFQMDMYTVSLDEIKAIINDEGGELLAVKYTNHTDPGFNGNLRILNEKEASHGFMSNLFIVRKK